MAYKFQLGAATLSGSLTQEGDITSEGDLAIKNSGDIGCAADSDLITLANQSVSFASDVDVNVAKAGGLQLGGVAVTATAAELNVLDGLAQGSILLGDGSGAAAITDIKSDGQILVGNGTTATSVAVSGDVALANDGAMTIQANAVEGSMINSNAAGDGLGYSSNALNVDAAQTVITSIYNTSLKLGRGATDDNIDFGTDDSIIMNIDNGEKFRVASGSITAAVATTFEDNVTIEGNLTVSGTTVEVDAAFIVTSSVQFEGSIPDGNELTLTTANPTADRTVTIPDLSGHVPLLAGAIGNANVTAAEFLLLDGGSTVDTATVADGDAVLFNDAGTMKQLNVTSLKTYFQSGVTATTAQGLRLNGADAVVNSAITASNDVLLVDCSSAAIDIEMPDITSDDIGQLYMIKDIVGNAATNNITINESTSNHDIDGSTSVLLESDNGAIMLLACSSSNGFFYSIF